VYGVCNISWQVGDYYSMCPMIVENAGYLDGTQDENLITLVNVNFFPPELEHFRLVLRMCPV